MATADAIQGGRPRLAPDRDLREIHFGAWELRSFAEIEAEDPERISAFWQAPGKVRAPSGEGWDDLRARVDGAVDRLVAKGGTVIAVAHFGAILTQIQRVAGLSTEEAFGHRIEPLSLTRIRFGEMPEVELLNHIP